MNFGGIGGFLADPLGLSGEKGKAAANEYKGTAADAAAKLRTGFDTAQGQLTTGMAPAVNSAKTGFQKAQDTAKAGYDAAHSELASGSKGAIDTAKSGFATAQSRLDAPAMVSSRQELFQRILGKGGYSADTMNAMEGKTREEYGTGMRGAEEGLKSFYGDSSAGGMAGENLARAAATLGSNRANSIRDIETSNEQLKRTEQTNAITATQNEAYQRAGLDSSQAEYISGLQYKLAEGGANLTAQETSALSTLAAQEGTTLADLQARLATGQASLSAEEATALANLTMGAAGNVATMANQKSGIGSLFGLG